MVTVTNQTNNPLLMSDGKMLPSGASRKLKSLGDREMNYKSRGWLNVIEEVKEEKTKEAK